MGNWESTESMACVYEKSLVFFKLFLKNIKTINSFSNNRSCTVHCSNKRFVTLNFISEVLSICLPLTTCHLSWRYRKLTDRLFEVMVSLWSYLVSLYFVNSVVTSQTWRPFYSSTPYWNWKSILILSMRIVVKSICWWAFFHDGHKMKVKSETRCFNEN